MPSTAPHIPVRWIALREAWKCSPWSSKTLLEFAKRGVLEARLEEGHWCFEPTGFYMAMREELALEHWRALASTGEHFVMWPSPMM